MMRNGRRNNGGNKQESASSCLKNGISQRVSAETDILESLACIDGPDPVTTDSSFSGGNNSESGWHTFIEKQDWLSMQRYLERLSSLLPMPQEPSSTSTNSNRGKSLNHPQFAPCSTQADGSKKKISSAKPKPSSSLTWLKRSVVSMGSISVRMHTTRLSYNRHHQASIEEHEEVNHNVGEHVHLDKESLLIRGSVGRTPLQLALNTPGAPELMILHLLRAQPNAASISDAKGRLPLHFAVVRQRRLETITKLVELYPEAIHQQDQRGKTPVYYAIEMAKRQTNLAIAPRTFWASLLPQEKEGPEATWQNRQYQQWEIARLLLQECASLQHYNSQTRQHHLVTACFRDAADDHQHPFLNNAAGRQQHVLIEAMLHAAPPSVVALLLEAASVLFVATDDDHRQEDYEDGIVSLGCSAFYLAIFRQYPLVILKRLGSLLGERKVVKTVQDETGLGLVSAHYVTSCFEKSKLLEYVAEEGFMLTMERCIMEGQLPENNVPFLEWWDKLKYLIFFCADKNTDQTSGHYLLHAALENSDTPPNVIRLLLALYPGSARQSDAQCAHPLHLLAKRRDYIPRNYESPYMHGLNLMGMLLSLDEGAVFHNFQGRLPLHHAIASGRTWSTIHPLVSSYRSSLRMPDPITKLYPCQLAAAYREESIEEETTRLLQLARNQYSAIVWQGLSQKQQWNAAERVRQFESLKRLDTIFELFRRYPQCLDTALGFAPNQRNKKNDPVLGRGVAVNAGVVNDDNDQGERKEREDVVGPEMITFHYLSWCYKKVGGVWRVAPGNMEILKISIRVAVEHRVLSQKSADFVKWWRMLKLYFWHCYNGMDDSDDVRIPRDDNYLLHLAVSIPTTPPALVELILGLYPHSASTPLPHSTTFPLHLACKTAMYAPQHFEVVQGPSTVQLVLDEFPEATFARSRSGQTPLHIAIQSGKTIEEVRPLIEQGPSIVLSRDPVTGLFPYQLMAMSKPRPNDLRIRIRTLAANRHARAWSKFTGQRKMKEIRALEKEYQMAILDSTFELLRLAPSAIEPSEVPRRIHAKPSSRSPMPPSISGGSLLGMESCASSDSAEPIPAPSSVRKKGIRRLASGVSRDSSVYGGSAFSTIDMISTISNVSSHLSFRRASSISDGKLSCVSDGKAPRPMLSEQGSDDEDSEIWSENFSFNDDTKRHFKEVETSADSKCLAKLIGEPLLSEQSQKSERQLEVKPKWEAPAYFAAESTSTPAMTIPVGRNTIPKAVVPIDTDVYDDISYLDNINPISKSSSSLQMSLTGDSLNSEEEQTIRREYHCDSAVASEDIRAMSREPQTVSDENLQARGRCTVPIESGNCSETEKVANLLEGTPDFSEEDIFSTSGTARKQPVLGTAAIITELEELKQSNDNGSIHNDTVSATGNPPKGGKTEEPVVVFRIRKSSCQRTGGLIRSKARRKSLGGSQYVRSSRTDFLCTLNASLPEGKMNFVGTLAVRSNNLPPGCSGLRMELDSPFTNFDCMARIQEFPDESEHRVLQERRSEETRNVTCRASVAAQHGYQPRLTLCPPSKSDPVQALLYAPPHATGASNYFPKAQNSQLRNKSSLEINSRTSKIGGKPEEVQLCFNCRHHSSEVQLLPCRHLCVCLVCAMEEIKSCPTCFGPVTDKRVVAYAAQAASPVEML